MTGSPNGDTFTPGYDPGCDESSSDTMISTGGVEFTTAIADAEWIEATEVGSPLLYDVVDAAALENTFFGTETIRTSRRGNGAVAYGTTASSSRLKRRLDSRLRTG